MTDFATFLNSGAAAAYAYSTSDPSDYGASLDQLSDLASNLSSNLSMQPPPPQSYKGARPPQVTIPKLRSRDRAISPRESSPRGRDKRASPASHRLVLDLHEWLCRRPEHARHIGTTASDDGGATFSEFYESYPQHAAKRKCKGSGIKAVVEAHGAGLLEWIDSGSCGMGRVQVVPGSDQLGRRSPPPRRRGLAVVVAGLPRATEPGLSDFLEAKGVRVDSIARLPATGGRQPGRFRVVLCDAASYKTALDLNGDYYRDSGRWFTVQPTESDLSPPRERKSPKRHVEQPVFCMFRASNSQCPYGDKCRYAHTPAELEAAHRRAHVTAADAEREAQLREVIEEAGLEDKWLQHFLANELDKDALLLCEDSDFDKLDLSFGARVKIRNWCDKQRKKRVDLPEQVTPPPEAMDGGGHVF